MPRHNRAAAAAARLCAASARPPQQLITPRLPGRPTQRFSLCAAAAAAARTRDRAQARAHARLLSATWHTHSPPSYPLFDCKSWARARLGGPSRRPRPACALFFIRPVTLPNTDCLHLLPSYPSRRSMPCLPSLPQSCLPATARLRSAAPSDDIKAATPARLRPPMRAHAHTHFRSCTRARTRARARTHMHAARSEPACPRPSPSTPPLFTWPLGRAHRPPSHTHTAARTLRPSCGAQLTHPLLASRSAGGSLSAPAPPARPAATGRLVYGCPEPDFGAGSSFLQPS